MNPSPKTQVLGLRASLKDGRVGEGIGVDALSEHFIENVKGVLGEGGFEAEGDEGVPRQYIEGVDDGEVGMGEEGGGGVGSKEEGEEGGVEVEAEGEEEGVGFRGGGGGGEEEEEGGERDEERGRKGRGAEEGEGR
ncbi:uncharacterized protein A4U43_C03F21550 [Asparagus officinalis]|uniref:Uncharacterized protein n=1 Tax=Asparagus officinalis TaxID=4686 RepID=A0A5P1FH15_ASPOF|nr:uncharacterized protein A4U43_C03F21550 [Asparagus officinalis]